MYTRKMWKSRRLQGYKDISVHTEPLYECKYCLAKVYLLYPTNKMLISDKLVVQMYAIGLQRQGRAV